MSELKGKISIEDVSKEELLRMLDKSYAAMMAVIGIDNLSLDMKLSDIPDVLKERFLPLRAPQSEWVSVGDRLPEIPKGCWRTDKAFPIITDQVGLTYAYPCVTSGGHTYWVESHKFGNHDGDMCECNFAREEITCKVISWMDIALPTPPKGE